MDVFHHFNIKVKKLFIDFTNVGIELKILQIIKAELILFSRIDALKYFVGNMGILTNYADHFLFIHSIFGKKTESPLLL